MGWRTRATQDALYSFTRIWENINNALRPDGGGERPQTFDLLIKLHARACQITEEVICLLGGGFADGAMARWRSIHEISAVSLIEEHGEGLAERYRLHEVVELRRRAAIQAL